jgi:ribosomal protein L11 methyltransferase
MNWLEVSLTVNGELAEAVADVLARFAPNGVVTEQGVAFLNEEDQGTPSGPIVVRAYLPADDQLEKTRQKLEESLFYLGMIQPLPAPVYTPVVDQNWMEAWKSRYKPIPIGRRLMIVPAWMDSPDPSRISIKIDPGMAFGTGTHPTTQLCLELIEQHIEKCHPEPPGEGSIGGPPDPSLPAHAQNDMDMTVIDIGCGSGILSIAALKLGAQAALGVDIDPESINSSRENAEANDVADRLILGLGSVDHVRAGKFALLQAHLVLANILAPVLVRLFERGLAELVMVGGEIILSGILDPQAQSVIYAGEQQGLKVVETKQIADWVALLMARPGGKIAGQA